MYITPNLVVPQVLPLGEDLGGAPLPNQVVPKSPL